MDAPLTSALGMTMQSYLGIKAAHPPGSVLTYLFRIAKDASYPTDLSSWCRGIAAFLEPSMSISFTLLRSTKLHFPAIYPSSLFSLKSSSQLLRQKGTDIITNGPLYFCSTLYHRCKTANFA
eukprot:08684_4